MVIRELTSTMHDCIQPVSDTFTHYICITYQISQHVPRLVQWMCRCTHYISAIPNPEPAALVSRLDASSIPLLIACPCQPCLLPSFSHNNVPFVHTQLHSIAEIHTRTFMSNCHEGAGRCMAIVTWGGRQHQAAVICLLQ